MLVYLAGAISWYIRNNKFNECLKWRISLTEKLNMLDVKCFNACTNLKQNMLYTNLSNLKQNVFYLSESDIIIVNTDHILESPGTIFELTYCYLKQKPVIGLGINENINSSFHLSSCIDQYLKDEDEVVEYIKSLYHLEIK
ncbi:Nucleoside 2-deoxyribosyltransferase [Pelotomaculum schinkii]|uniref:Nucleoside 2-deoxyribosyltransferase n=1 Tax=Pelotomaculum schinkii TaxID=78350 RepID=A0A4Y7RIG6_9FIRM|nr:MULTISPECIES: leucine-rich repeat protein [Pelotomaculum]TEB08603.1 Nucleoside 2-deoxyribosyltransferase [Pelotomaculum schinkii]TEB16800.1 Nucleoside 2-deoxyribosyltransferase [Pelotomaculum sp. FP]